MKLPLPIAVLFVLSLGILTYANSDEVSVNDTDTLKITVSNITPGIKATFIIKDSMHTRALKSRMQEIKTMIPELRTTLIVNEPSALGYKGLGVHSTTASDLFVFNSFDGQMTVLSSSLSSKLDYLNDFNSEMENFIANVGIQENLTTSDNGKTILFSSLIPDELKRTDTRYGILTLEITTDTFNIDFSLLIDKTNYIPARVKRSIFKDIQITRALEISSSQYAFRISAPEGTALLQKNAKIPMQSNLTLSSSSIDSLLKASIPILDSCSNNLDTMHFEQNLLFSPDVHTYSYLIKTTDLGIVYLKPISYFIGGIDRLSFFWVYSSNSIFDSAALKLFNDQTSLLRPVAKTITNATNLHTRLINLSGRVFEQHRGNLNTLRRPGIYLKEGTMGKNSFIKIK